MTKRCVELVMMVMAFLYASSVCVAASESNDAVVTALQGSAKVYSAGVAAGRSLKKGDRIGQEQELKVAGKSRIELRFPDGTVMRLSEGTHLRMSELSFNRKTDDKNVKVDLPIGKLWANVRKLSTPKSAVEVKTSNAVAGVRGTVYRVNVEEDKSALIKVYDGSVYVANPPRDAAGTPPVQVSKPTEVPGPHEVPPPYHEVSMEEWTVIVQAMQQISISPQGVASQPQDFDAKSDADDWVKWNQERDKQMSF
ncbi:MAG TPA: FecR family protein [Nitrospirota bacterium]